MQPTQPSYIVVDFEMRNDIAPGSPGAARNELLQSAIKRGSPGARQSQRHHRHQRPLARICGPNRKSACAGALDTALYTYIPSAPGEFGELLASVEKTLHNVESLDFNAMNHLLLGDLKSAGQVLDNARQFDFGGLSTNANSLLTDLQISNSKLKSLIQDTDNTIQKVKLERLTHDLDSLVGQLQDVVARVEPGVTSIDFNALNQTLANTRQTIRDLDDVLAELKQYPSGFLFGKPPEPIKGVETSGTR